MRNSTFLWTSVRQWQNPWGRNNSAAEKTRLILKTPTQPGVRDCVEEEQERTVRIVGITNKSALF